MEKITADEAARLARMEMDPRNFQPGLMGLAADIDATPRLHRSRRVARWHAGHH